MKKSGTKFVGCVDPWDKKNCILKELRHYFWILKNYMKISKACFFLNHVYLPYNEPSGCKKSHFYSLPFGQVVANMY